MSVIALAFAVLLPFAGARCPAPDARLEYLTETLKSSAESERAWARGWGWSWTGVTAGQLGVAAVTNDSQLRTDLLVGAAGSALGIVPTLILPPAVIGDYERFSRRGSGDEPCPSTADAEGLLAKDVEDKKWRRGAVAHLGNVLVNAAISGIYLAVSEGATSAILSSALGIPIGAFMIISQPTGAIGRYESYRTRTVKFSLLMGRDRAGVGASLAF